MPVNRIPTHVRGFDEALSGGLPEGYVTLGSGAPGTMKSSFCFSILYQNALQDGRKSAYFTLEQSKDILLEHMAELGFTDEKAFKNMMVLDMGTVRKNLNFLQARGTWIELFKMYASNFMKAEKISLLVVDSMDVMETMAKFQDRRTDLYYFFEWLRDLGPTSLVISENPADQPVTAHYPDDSYLADRTIQLGLHATSDRNGQPRARP